MNRLKVNNNLYWLDLLRIGGTVKNVREWVEEDPKVLYDFITTKKGRGKRLQRHIWLQLEDKITTK